MEKATKHTNAYTQMISIVAIYEKQAQLRFTALVAETFFEMIDDDIYSVDLYVDKENIEIVPNKNGEFTVSNNKSNSGFRVALPMYLVKKYNLHSGHYETEVKDNGTIHIYLTRGVEVCSKSVREQS